MTQNQITNQYKRITRAVVNAYEAYDAGEITDAQLNSKLATAQQARNTASMNQEKLDIRGY